MSFFTHKTECTSSSQLSSKKVSLSKVNTKQSFIEKIDFSYYLLTSTLAIRIFVCLVSGSRVGQAPLLGYDLLDGHIKSLQPSAPNFSGFVATTPSKKWVRGPGGTGQF